MDIVTHLAVCASQDWNKVDRIVVGNFVTASQAQRKWYTKVISKVSSGDYKLGAVSLFLRPGLGCCCYGLDADGWWVVELGQYNCAEQDDGAAGGGKDASVCQAWD